MRMVSPFKLDTANIGSWPSYYKILLWILGIIFIFLMFNQLFFNPIKERELSNNQIIQNLKKEFIQNYQYTIDLDQYKLRSSALFEELENLLKFLPNQSEMPQLVDNVAQAAAEVGINISEFKPEKVKNLGDFYNVIPISLYTTTHFMNFAKFAEKLTQLERIMNISGFSLSVNKGQGNNSQDYLSEDLLSIKGEFQTYIYNQDIIALKKGDMSSIKVLKRKNQQSKVRK